MKLKKEDISFPPNTKTYNASVYGSPLISAHLKSHGFIPAQKRDEKKCKKLM